MTKYRIRPSPYATGVYWVERWTGYWPLGDGWVEVRCTMNLDDFEDICKKDLEYTSRSAQFKNQPTLTAVAYWLHFYGTGAEPGEYPKWVFKILGR